MAIGSGNESSVEYFLSELNSLRDRAALFAEENPKVARELLLGRGRSDDPHVELLFQSFAYLTGRLRYDLDAALPDVSVNLIRYLYPHLETPTPPMAIVQLELYPDGADYENGYPVKKGKLLKRTVTASDHKAYDVVFSCAYDTDLWPIKIDSMEVVPINDLDFIESAKYRHCRSAIRVSLSSLQPGIPISPAMSSLRFWIDPGRTDNQAFYDVNRGLLGAVTARQVKEKYTDARPLAIDWLGMDDRHAVLPYKRCSHRAYRLLQEYFAFPEKYWFFEFSGIDVPEAATTLDIILLFDQDITQMRELSEARLRINCVPVINLYRSMTDPIRPDERSFENLLVPDAQSYRGMEIHTIEKVVATDVQGRSRTIPPFLPQERIGESVHDECYWSTRRDFTERMHLPGTQSYISLHNRDTSPQFLPRETVHAEVLVTNRDIAENMHVGTEMRVLGEGPFARATLVTKPSRHRTPAVRGIKPWLLVSQLSLNFSALGGDDDSLEAIKNLLRLYSDDNNDEHQRSIDSMYSIDSRASVRRIGPDAWRGFCHGVTVTITIDEKRRGVASLKLFGEILSRFLALYASANSFVRLVFESKQTQRVLEQWPPMAGEKVLL